MINSRLLAGERILLTLWVGGLWAIGYMVAPAHILQGDTPLENVEAMIEAVRTHGIYR